LTRVSPSPNGFEWIRFDLDAARPAQLTSAFAWILPLGGVVMTYPVGWMLDNLAMWQCVFALSFAGLIHSCLGILEVSQRFSSALEEFEAQIN